MLVFYKANFCCDCGVILKNNSWRQRIFFSSSFCKSCSKRLRNVIWKKRFLYIFLLPLLSIFLSKNYFTSSVKKEDTIYKVPNIEPVKAPVINVVSKEATWLCGAKTKKGKQCQRRVKVPGYCWQHQGLSK